MSVLLSVIGSDNREDIFNLDDIKMIIPVVGSNGDGPYVVVFSDGRQKTISSFNFDSISHSASLDLGTAFGALDLTPLKNLRDVVLPGPGRVITSLFINIKYVRRVYSSGANTCVVETNSPNITYSINASLDTVKPQLGVIQVDDQTTV